MASPTPNLPLLLVIQLFAVINLVENKMVTVSMDLTRSVHQVNERFLSVAFGASMIDSNRYPLKDVLRSRKLITLASALAPAYLRLGGTAADFITFYPDLRRDGEDERCHVDKTDVSGANLNTLVDTMASFHGVEHPPEADEQSEEDDKGVVETDDEALEEMKRLAESTSEPEYSSMESQLVSYWYECGCESELPQMNVFRRDRLKIAKREQLGLFVENQGATEERDMSTEDDDVDSIVDEPVDDPTSSGELGRRRSTRKKKKKRENRNITMTGGDWDEINGFARATGLRLLFDVNVLITTPSGEWNSTNAAELLRYGAARNYSLDFQLGNEPNHFQHHVHRSVSPEQLARDFWSLRHLLQSGIGGGDGVDAALLVGPDVTRPKNKRDVEYLRDFLKDAVDAIDAITWHQYYVNGRTATLEEFVDPKILNLLRQLIRRVLDVRATTPPSAGPSRPIWLTETASAYGGGACGLSDRFVDGFFWLDKLGTAASMGLDVVTRQTLWKGQYGLLDGDLTFNPRPDYWLTLLFKRLVGTEVLKVVHDGDDDGDSNSGFVRLYAHCASSSLPPTSSARKGASVTLFGMNLLDEHVNLRLANASSGEGLSEGKVVVRNFILESNRGKLWSKLVRLNGRTIHMPSDDALPPLKPVVEKFRDITQVQLQLPPFALAFFVIDGLESDACAR